jgi:hypothetical protein
MYFGDGFYFYGTLGGIPSTPNCYYYFYNNHDNDDDSIIITALQSDKVPWNKNSSPAGWNTIALCFVVDPSIDPVRFVLSIHGCRGCHDLFSFHVLLVCHGHLLDGTGSCPTSSGGAEAIRQDEEEKTRGCNKVVVFIIVTHTIAVTSSSSSSSLLVWYRSTIATSRNGSFAIVVFSNSLGSLPD